MTGKKEIRGKIASIRNTQKITGAMQMVSAGKMRKAMDRMNASRPYARRIAEIIHHLSHANPEYRHPYLIDRPEKRIAVFIVSSDRGLCGGLNANLFRQVLRQIKTWQNAGIEVSLGLLGRKAEQFFGSFRAPVIAQVSGLGDSPHPEGIHGVLFSLIKDFEAGKIDAIYLAYNEFGNTMTQKPLVTPFLPIRIHDMVPEMSGPWDYLYEPDAQTMLDFLLRRFVESIAFQAVVENIASEQAARMIAMKSASDNAGTLIKELQTIYNKARQAAITQEIAEIIAGASAV